MPWKCGSQLVGVVNFLPIDELCTLDAELPHMVPMRPAPPGKYYSSTLAAQISSCSTITLPVDHRVSVMKWNSQHSGWKFTAQPTDVPNQPVCCVWVTQPTVIKHHRHPCHLHVCLVCSGWGERMALSAYAVHLMVSFVCDQNEKGEGVQQLCKICVVL